MNIGRSFDATFQIAKNITHVFGLHNARNGFRYWMGSINCPFIYRFKVREEVQDKTERTNRKKRCEDEHCSFTLDSFR